jgi:hypothetical protein
MGAVVGVGLAMQGLLVRHHNRGASLVYGVVDAALQALSPTPNFFTENQYVAVSQKQSSRPKAA